MKNGWFWHKDAAPKIALNKMAVINRVMSGLSSRTGWPIETVADFWRAFVQHFGSEVLENGFIILPGIGEFYVNGPYQRWMDLADGRFTLEFRLSPEMRAKLKPTAVKMAKQRRKAGLKDPLRPWQMNKKIITQTRNRINAKKNVDHDALPD